MSKTAGKPSTGSNVNLFDPIAVARADAYFKRNHIGKVTCTLCNVYCNDENAFLKHTAGKTHALQLENMDRLRTRRRRIEEEERIDAEKAIAAAKEKTTRDLLASSASTSAGGGAAIVTGRFGLPLYSFRTVHEEGGDAKDGDDEKNDAEGGGGPTEGPAAAGSSYQTKVWLEFVFSKAEEGTRPLHRWLSAREQHVETPADDYYTYLLLACEGYTTVALKFPAKLHRTQEGDASDARGESVYHCWWDPLRKEYSLYFVLSR